MDGWGIFWLLWIGFFAGCYVGMKIQKKVPDWQAQIDKLSEEEN